MEENHDLLVKEDLEANNGMAIGLKVSMIAIRNKELPDDTNDNMES